MESPIKLSKWSRTKLLDQEIIKIEEFSTEKSIPSVWHWGAITTQHPLLSDFKIGYVEEKRQIVNQCIADKKFKTSFTSFASVVHFNVRIAKFTHNSLIKDDGEWKAMPDLFSIDEDNRALMFQQLAMFFLLQAQGQAKSSILKK